MEQTLKLHTYIDGVSTPFPSEENQIEISSFNYDAKRMGGAPTITASVMFPTCLDNVWVDEVYTEFNSERYYLKQTPTSSKSNTDARYKHEIELVSERIALDNVYFYDTVIGKPVGDDKPVSNSSTFTFFGTIKEFAKRLNASLIYSGLEYRVAETNIDSEEKLLSFDNQPFSTAIQEAYNQFQIPYYFKGKTIYFGYFDTAISETFKYGVNNQLLSITKSNANQKVITRCTGTGGSENIPYYYPNAHPQGEIKPVRKRNGVEQEDAVMIVDDALFAKKVLLTDDLAYTSYVETVVSGLRIESYQIKDFKEYKNTVTNKGLISGGALTETNWFLAPNKNWTDKQKESYSTAALGHYESVYDNLKSYNVSKDNNEIAFRITFDEKYFIPYPSNSTTTAERTFKFTIVGLPKRAFGDTIKFVRRGGDQGYDVEDTYYKVTKQGDGSTWTGEFAILEQWFADELNYDKAIYLVLKLAEIPRDGKTFTPKVSIEFKSPTTHYEWQKNGEHYVNLQDFGLYDVLSPQLNDTITFKQVSYVQPMQTLMPPIYWESAGAERFYNAENGKYVYPETGEFYVFKNPYKPSKRIEHIVDFPEIKPTIANVVNAKGNTINVFTEFAFDKDDNDAVDNNGNYIHPYFYGKLRVFDGENGFNLFTHASEKGEVAFSMTSGVCGACNFVLAVDSETGKNTVQVDNEGNLVRKENGDVKLGLAQERQNDTSKYEVWVALKKDTNTFGHIMPSAQHSYRPSAGDTFVLLNINMPIQYVKAAEEKLKQEIVKYMYENNDEKFTFSIKFSRIYFSENENTLKQLNENSLIKIEYNGKEYTLYVNSFAYKMSNSEPLPEITVELAKTLTTSQNALQTAVSEVKTEVLDRVQKMDVAAMVATKFLSKDEEDYAKQKITFNKGLSVGTESDEVAKINELGEADLESAILKKYISSPSFVDGFTGNGFKLWLDENGLSHLTVDVLTARQRMVIYEMLISKIRAVNGALWVTAANGTIAKVVENGDNYEITLNETNTFVSGDYMRCQVFNGAGMRSYWVEVSMVDGNRVYVPKSEFEDTMPLVGDDVVLCGSKNPNRQNAIHISATDDGKPRISIYNGIATKSIDGCLRTQLGDLNNINDDVLKPHGDGLYSDNAYLKGELVLESSGKKVSTHFQATSDGIKSAVGTLQNDYDHGKTILYNPSFTKGEDGWITSNGVAFYSLGADLLYNNGMIVYNNAHENTDPDYNNHRFVLNISKGYIKQLNEYFVNKPEINKDNMVSIILNLKVMIEESGVIVAYIDGCDIPLEKANAFRCVSQNEYWAGMDLTFSMLGVQQSFIGIDKDINIGDNIIATNINGNIRLYNATKNEDVGCKFRGFAESAQEEFNEPIILLGMEELTESDDYLQLGYISRWNGTGNFNLSFSGGASVYSLQLFSNSVEVRYATFFEQSDRLIKFGAQQLNPDGSISKESGLLTKPTGTGIYAFNAETGAYAELGVSVDEDGKSKIKLKGDNVVLEGDITANGNVRIDEKTGTLHAKDAEISGYIKTAATVIDSNTVGDYVEAVALSDGYQFLISAEIVGSLLYIDSDAVLTYFNNELNLNLSTLQLWLPSFSAQMTAAGTVSNETKNACRALLGNTCAVYNIGKSININLNVYTSVEGDSASLIYSGGCAQYKCKMDSIAPPETPGKKFEAIVWEEVANAMVSA